MILPLRRGPHTENLFDQGVQICLINENRISLDKWVPLNGMHCLGNLENEDTKVNIYIDIDACCYE